MTKAGSGAAAATVTSEPAGIECGTECGPHNFGLATVKLTAVSGPGDVFVGWSGASCDGGPKSNPCEFTFSFLNSGDRNFTATFAPPPDPPLASTGGVVAVGEFSATMNGTVIPSGTAVETCRFEYGTTTSYGASLPCAPRASEIGEGNAEVDVSAHAAHLEPGTTYHYRLVAANFGGTSNGADMTFATVGAPVCSNADRRLEQGIASILLPGCMALEMVSPPQKNNQPAYFPNISVGGERVRFVSIAALGETPNLLNFAGDDYVATRSASGWRTGSTTSPAGLVRGWGQTGVPKGFSPDFATWFQIAATNAQTELGIARAFRAGLGRFFSPFSPLLVPLGGGGPNDVALSEFEGASSDLSHLYFRPGGLSVLAHTAAYLPDDPRPPGGSGDNVYVARLDASGVPVLELIARDGDGEVWGGTCGPSIGRDRGAINQGAISSDGTRAYISLRPTQAKTENCNIGNKLRIFKRLESKQGVWIGPLFTSDCTREAPPCSSVDGDDRYQGAASDGSTVYFTTNRQLANSDLDGTSTECSSTSGVAGCDLYLFDSSLPPGQRLIQVSAGEATAAHPAVGAEAKVYDGTVAISGDGSHVYFAAAAVLTEDQNPEGARAVDGQPNLYLYQRDDAHPEGDLSFIGTLVSGDRNGLWGREGTWRNGAYPVPVLGSGPGGEEAGGDGHVLFFQSKASLTAADADGGRLDIYRYAAAGAQPTLDCISCRLGGPDSEPFDVTARRSTGAAGPDFAEEGRWVSEDGEAAVFTTPEGLLPGEEGGSPSSYLWHGGELYRLPGEPYVKTPRSDGPVVSRDGSEVAFQTFSQLLPQDGDTSADVYVARTGGGFPNPPPPVPCEPGSDCQPAQAPPVAPGSASETSTQGNVKPDRCAAPARQARNLSRRAKQIRTRARRATRHNPKRAKAERRKAKRLGRRAHKLSRRAKRCRAGLPQQTMRADAKRSSVHRAHHRRRAR